MSSYNGVTYRIFFTVMNRSECLLRFLSYYVKIVYLCSMGRFNPFEKAIDFSFWKEICEEHGTLWHYSRGEYFVHAETVLKQIGWILSGGFKHSLIDNTDLVPLGEIASYLNISRRQLYRIRESVGSINIKNEDKQ